MDIRDRVSDQGLFTGSGILIGGRFLFKKLPVKPVMRPEGTARIGWELWVRRVRIDV